MGLVSKKSGRRSEIKRKVEKRPQFEKFEAAESKDLGTIILKPAPPPSLSADLPLPEEREKTEGQNLTITDDTTNRTSE